MAELITPRRNIPELNNSNFLQWKIQVQAYLMELDLLDCIIANPEPLQDPVKQAEVVRKRQKTAGILLGTRVFLEFLTVKQEGNLEDFITNITQLLGKVASVGIVIGTPGDIKESLMAEIIVSKLSSTYNYTKEILQSQRPLNTPKNLINANKVIKEDSDFSSIDDNSPTVHFALNTTSSVSDIIADTGCSHHMTSLKSLLGQYEEIDSTITVANGKQAPIVGKGVITILSNGIYTSLPCLHVPSLTATLLIVGKLCKAGFHFKMKGQRCFELRHLGKLQLNGQIFH
ncbi:hypothetical protein O181_121446 [Austropuccinia psidii MF-1]|uniref:Retrovirus-related Pol polyprotein from transposon TNT 1-94-like beta-barrel domain-containing protein n=1 Tax=Austropuccinia psidii MF-1 TaxID=1389203 RepID=A0A9Q3KJM9_9BASI|nr:hypothetical protein [Austropuccinia psidii MF-1]